MAYLHFGNLIMYPIGNRLTPCRVHPVTPSTVLHNCVSQIVLKPLNSPAVTLRFTNKVADTILQHNSQFKIKSYATTL